MTVDHMLSLFVYLVILVGMVALVALALSEWPRSNKKDDDDINNDFR